MRMDIYSVGYGREKDKRVKEQRKRGGKKWVEGRDRNCLFGREMERPVVDFFFTQV